MLKGCCSAVVYSLFIVAPIVCGSIVLGPCICFTVLCEFYTYSFAIILLGKRELVALFFFCSESHVGVIVL